VRARARGEDLARTRDRPGDGVGKLLGLLLQEGGHGVHRHRPVVGGTKRRRMLLADHHRRAVVVRRNPAKLPYAGMGRIRFEGSVSTAPCRRDTPASRGDLTTVAPVGLRKATPPGPWPYDARPWPLLPKPFAHAPRPGSATSAWASTCWAMCSKDLETLQRCARSASRQCASRSLPAARPARSGSRSTPTATPRAAHWPRCAGNWTCGTA